MIMIIVLLRPSIPVCRELPKLRKDFTVQDLKAFDGNQPDGRVLVAVNGKVYDVTKGKRFYGPGKLEPRLLSILTLTQAISVFTLPLQFCNIRKVHSSLSWPSIPSRSSLSLSLARSIFSCCVFSYRFIKALILLFTFRAQLF
jgi:hypothetical protein